LTSYPYSNELLIIPRNSSNTRYEFCSSSTARSSTLVYYAVQYVRYGNKILSNASNPPPQGSLSQGSLLSPLQVSHISTSIQHRKLLLLFNWLHPLSQILAQQSVPFSAEITTEKAAKIKKPFLQTLLYAPPPVLLELTNAIADDIATWSRLGLLGKRIGSTAEKFSDWCWFLATLVGLVENGVERQMIGGLQAEGTLSTLFEAFLPSFVPILTFPVHSP